MHMAKKDTADLAILGQDLQQFSAVRNSVRVQPVYACRYRRMGDQEYGWAKRGRSWGWIEAADLGNSAAECLIGIDPMKLLVGSSYDVRIRQLDEIPRLLHGASSALRLPAPHTSCAVGMQPLLRTMMQRDDPALP